GMPSAADLVGPKRTARSQQGGPSTGKPGGPIPVATTLSRWSHAHGRRHTGHGMRLTRADGSAPQVARRRHPAAWRTVILIGTTGPTPGSAGAVRAGSCDTIAYRKPGTTVPAPAWCGSH